MGWGWPWENSSGLGEGWAGWCWEGFLFSAPGYGGTDCKHTQTGLGLTQEKQERITANQEVHAKNRAVFCQLLLFNLS